MHDELMVLQAAPPRDDGPPLRAAWVVMADAVHADFIAHALSATDWQVPQVLHGFEQARALLQSGLALPDVIVMGLRFDDGDGLRLIRELGLLAGTPAVFLASSQQRAVLKAAQSLAEVCGVAFAGMSERPADATGVAALLADYRAAPRRSRPAPVPAPLDREETCAIMARNQIVPWLQAKVRLDTLEVIGVEALMRGFDQDGHLVTPDRLIPVLTHYDLLDEATLRMVRHTADFVVRCLGEGLAISASVNVSMISLARFDFCQQLERIIQNAGLDPSWITLEITETDAMSHVAQVVENTARIRMLGFNLAIDDFGTAYSSLEQLARIPFSELKIERAFVSGAQHHPGKRASLAASAMLGRSLGLQVVAEGVETLEDLDCARRAGCTHVQGYLISRPVPVAAALDWLHSPPDCRVCVTG